MSTADFTKATRELFVRSLVNEVHMKTPIVEELQRRSQVTFTGGKYIERLVDTDDINELWQEYSVNTALTDGKKTTLDKPRFTWRYAQLPLRYDADEETENIHAGSEIQLLNLAEHLSKKGQDATRLRLCQWIFNNGSTTPVQDGGSAPQSLISALDHDTYAYGTLSRSLSGGTNDWWQGADPADLTQNITSSSQDTAYNISVVNLRKWINETDIAHYMEGDDDLMIVMSPTLWGKLAAEAESKVLYKPGLKQKQGIKSAYIDGYECVSVPYLQKSSTMKTWLFILNLRYWELRIHTARNFKMGDFKWQGENANGFDYWLARVLFKGNFVCWKPNSSMWLSAVS